MEALGVMMTRRHRSSWWWRTIPVTVRYGDAGVIHTNMKVRKYGAEPDWFASCKVKRPGEEEWKLVVGDVSLERDIHGRVSRMWIYFDIPTVFEKVDFPWWEEWW